MEWECLELLYFNKEVDERSNVGLGEINNHSSNDIINYEIDENSHKAKIVIWPNAEGQIVINKIVIYESKKYEITEIYHDAFKSSKAEIIVVKMYLKIGDSCFSGSNLQPPNLNEIICQLVTSAF